MIEAYKKTLQDLLRTPRKVIDGFLTKSQGSYQNPLTFCLIGAVVVILLNTLLVDFTTSLPPIEIETENEQLELIAEWIQVANIRAATQFLPLSLMLIFILSLSLPGLFFFRDQMEGFYSNLILNTYAVGAAQLFLLLLIPAWMWLDVPMADPLMNSTLPAVLTAGVILWIYTQYFRPEGFVSWLNVLSSYIVGHVLFVMLLGFAASVAGYMLYAVNRILELAG